MKLSKKILSVTHCLILGRFVSMAFRNFVISALITPETTKLYFFKSPLFKSHGLSEKIKIQHSTFKFVSFNKDQITHIGGK